MIIYIQRDVDLSRVELLLLCVICSRMRNFSAYVLLAHCCHDIFVAVVFQLTTIVNLNTAAHAQLLSLFGSWNAIDSAKRSKKKWIEKPLVIIIVNHMANKWITCVQVLNSLWFKHKWHFCCVCVLHAREQRREREKKKKCRQCKKPKSIRKRPRRDTNITSIKETKKTRKKAQKNLWSGKINDFLHWKLAHHQFALIRLACRARLLSICFECLARQPTENQSIFSTWAIFLTFPHQSFSNYAHASFINFVRSNSHNFHLAGRTEDVLNVSTKIWRIEIKKEEYGTSSWENANFKSGKSKSRAVYSGSFAHTAKQCWVLFVC